MNIGIRLHDTAGASLREHLANAKAQGFHCVHLAMSKAVPGFRMADAPELLTDALAEEVRSALAEYDMQCAVLGCYLNLATPDEAAYAHTLEIYKAHLRFAKAIGAQVVGTETGAPNTGYKTCTECFTEESLQLFINRVRPVIDYADELGQKFAIEPVCRHIVSDPERAARVLAAYPTENLRIILDAVNLLSLANCGRAGEVIRQAIQLLGDRTEILHMKDYTDQAGDWFGSGVKDLKSVACGHGGMDYTDLLRFAAAHPGIPMTLEDTKPDNAEAARLYLEGLAEKLK